VPGTRDHEACTEPGLSREVGGIEPDHDVRVGQPVATLATVSRMAKEAYVVAGDREVRISSPDRVIYEATERTPEVTKLRVAEYFAAVSGALLDWIGDRPTALERWPDGWREGMRLATGPMDKEGDGFYQKRVPKGAPEYVETVRIAFPSRRTADEVCPSEPAVPVWCAQMGTLTFHPWPVRRPDVDHPDELRLDLDPQPGTSFQDAVRVAGVARELLAELGLTGLPKTSGNRGVHIFVPIAPRWTFEDVRHAALAFGRELEKRDDGITTAWWKEERGERIFVDFNQNNRDRTIASAYSLRPLPGAPVSTPVTWDELADLDDPRRFDLFTVQERVAAGEAPPYDGTPGDLTPLLALWEADPRESNWPPDYPKMPGEPPRVQPSKKVAAHWDEEGNRIEP
jgi:DNA ligase D-like protein (predicted polymerase)